MNERNGDARPKKASKDGKRCQHVILVNTIVPHLIAAAPDGKEPTTEQSRLATVVSSRVTQLTSNYVKHRRLLDQPGAGLTSEEGSDIQNCISRITSEWSWWTRLHSVRCKLSNYRPVGISSSEPRLDHAARAAVLFAPSARSKAIVEKEPVLTKEDLDQWISTFIDIDAEGGVDFDQLPTPLPDLPARFTPTMDTTLHLRQSSDNPKPPPTAELSTQGKPNLASQGKLSMASFLTNQAIHVEMISRKRKLQSDERLASLDLKMSYKKAKLQMELDHQAREAERNREFELTKLQLQLQIQQALRTSHIASK